MAQVHITIDMDSPEDVEILTKLLGMQLDRPPAPPKEGYDIEEVVAELMGRVGLKTRQFLVAFVDTAEAVDDKKPLTLHEVAEFWGQPYEVVKSKRLNLGRSINKLQEKFPGLGPLFEQVWDQDAGENVYTLSVEFREAVWAWADTHEDKMGGT